MIGVCTSIPSYRVAAAELPSSVRTVSRVDGAVAVLQGDRGWALAARTAMESGAVAVVIACPEVVDIDECSGLQEAAGERPIVIDRPMLRADLVNTASVHVASPSYAAVEVAAGAGRLSSAIRDAAGWVRVLLGGPCGPPVIGRTGSAAIALLQSADGGAPGALTVTTTAANGQGPWMRATAVASTRVEVVVDEADGRASIEVARADGILRLPRRFETPERLALRRAIEAVVSPASVTDLAELRADAVIAQALDPTCADKQY